MSICLQLKFIQSFSSHACSQFSVKYHGDKCKGFWVGHRNRKKYMELDMMSSDGACIIHSSNTGHNSVCAMYMHVVSAMFGGTVLCQILGCGALSLL